MDSSDFGKTIETSIRALTAVSDMSQIGSVPSVARGNDESHAIGLGQMNSHGYLARERIYYGSEEGVDFTNIYFYTVTYHAIRASNLIAVETGKSFKGFEKSNMQRVNISPNIPSSFGNQRRKRFEKFSKRLALRS